MVDREDPLNRPPGTGMDREYGQTGAGGRLTQVSPPGMSGQQTPGQTRPSGGSQSGGSPSSDGGGMDAGQMKEKTTGAREKAAEVVSTARDKAGEMTQTATEAVDARRDQTAQAMDSAATQLREHGKSLPGGERTTGIASMAADKVEATSTYIREHEVQHMMTDLEALVRKHPAQSLVLAGVAGFLVGRMTRG